MRYRDLGQRLRDLAVDEVGVGRGAADHGAEGDDDVELAACGELVGDHRKLVGAGDADDCHLLVGSAVAGDAVKGAFHQLLGDEAVEAADRDCEGDALRLKSSVQFVV